jgi:hypothetical protein
MSTGQPGVAQRGGGRGIEFFKPRNGFKVYNRVLLGVAVVFMAAMIALGVALGQEKALNDKLAHFYSGTTPVLGITGMDLWNRQIVPPPMETALLSSLRPKSIPASSSSGMSATQSTTTTPIRFQRGTPLSSPTTPSAPRCFS